MYVFLWVGGSRGGVAFVLYARVCFTLTAEIGGGDYGTELAAITEWKVKR